MTITDKELNKTGCYSFITNGVIRVLLLLNDSVVIYSIIGLKYGALNRNITKGHRTIITELLQLKFMYE